MINIENEVVTIISKLLNDEFDKKIYVTGEYISAPPSFPTVSIVEEDNYTDRTTLTQENTENHANVMYEINVYSNKQDGKKTEARKIRDLVDEKMQNLGFIRMMSNPVPNFDSPSIYRIVSRYRAKVSKDKVIYR